MLTATKRCDYNIVVATRCCKEETDLKTTINKEILTAIKRKRGELNITINKLASDAGISRFTVYRLFDGENNVVHPTTKEKLVTWLAKNS